MREIRYGARGFWSIITQIRSPDLLARTDLVLQARCLYSGMLVLARFPAIVECLVLTLLAKEERNCMKETSRLKSTAKILQKLE